MNLNVATQPVPGRSCTGIGCALCCKLPTVSELNKPINTWCKHASPKDAGDCGACTIYSDRPNECKNFMCVWLYTDWWPEELSPRKTGCFVIFDADEGLPIARVHEDRIHASHALDEVLCKFWFGGCPIVVYTPNKTVQCIGYLKNGRRMTIFERNSDGTPGTVKLPVVTRETVARYGGFDPLIKYIAATWEQRLKELEGA